MSVFTQSRSYIVRIIFAIAFLVIIGRLFTLQVMSSKYQRLAQENAIAKRIVYPPRGIIYDRNGKALVTNVQMTDLMVIPSEARGVDTAYICQLLEIDTTEFKTRMVTAIVKNGRSRASVCRPDSRSARRDDGARPNTGGTAGCGVWSAPCACPRSSR